MKKIITIISACAALGATMTSCEDMDMVPKAQGNSESWYSNETELQMAVNEFYILGYWKEPLESSEQWTDNFTYRNQNRNPGSNGTLLDGTMTGNQWEVYALWQQSYKLIARANSMLENSHKALGAVSQETLDRFNAEAYFCRACKYGDLAFYFGDVPFNDHSLTISEALAQTPTPKAEVVKHVYEDFDMAIASLPTDWGTKAKHITKGGALAMKARYALYFGDYELAAEAAKQCMDLKIYSLEPDYAKLFLQSTKENDEKVFYIPRSLENDVILDQWFVNNGLPRNAGGYAADTPSWDLLAAYLCTDGLPIDESPLFNPRRPFENRDPRCTMTIVEFNTVHCGFEFDPSPAATKVMNYNTGAMQANQDTRKVNQYASYNGLIWKKGIDASWTENGKKVERDYVMMRYADVLLMYAEAMIELDKIDDSVINAINMVRARAYGVSYTAEDLYPAVKMSDRETLRRAVRLERRVELANEALRLPDLYRWKLATKALNGYNYIMLPADECLDKVVNKNLWFWSHTPQIDEDGLADFSALLNAGTIAVGAKRVFPESQYTWPVPTHDFELNPNLRN
ncbi:MAG: RagB/SusD family nutrient uptake outer membrane protein [Clostridium sp.]|nr:RagB/SusD family nutrient uptake outer membrane protein [Clostridium sp.]